MKKQTVIYPFLFAAYSVLGMYSANINEIRPEDVFRPLLVALSSAGILMMLFYLFKKNGYHAGLLSLIAIMAIINFGHSVNAFVGFLGNENRALIVYAMIFFWGLAFVLIWTDRMWKLIRGGPGLTLYLNLIGLLVLILPAFIAASELIKYYPERRSVHEYVARQAITAQVNPSTMPDIYYIILDGYGRQDVIKELYGLDNSTFIHWLEDRGFYIASQSQSNYMRTMFALASSLNLEYLKDNDPRIRFMIDDSVVKKTLENFGYTTIGMSSATINTQMTHVDEFYSPYSRDTLTLFEGFLITNSILGPFARMLDLNIPIPSYDYHRDMVTYTLDQLPKIAVEPGPKFVFAHILAPHPPFSFNADGTPNDPEQPFAIGDATDFGGTTEEYIQGYSGQLKFVSGIMPEVIQDIMDNSPRPFVIILQGDHGGGAYLDYQDLEKNNCFIERFSILNAYYFSPGLDRDAALAQLTPDITPVNSFRVILNAYMGTDLEILPNRHYYSTDSRYFNLLDVTGQTASDCRIPAPSHPPRTGTP